MTETLTASVSRGLIKLYLRVCEENDFSDPVAVETELTRLRRLILSPAMPGELALYNRFVKLIALRLPSLNPELALFEPKGGVPGAVMGQKSNANVVPPISGQGQPGISLVTCSMNRSANLVRAMKSWVACPEITEILVVDWFSDRPVVDDIRDAGITDARVRVVRVEDEPRWILSYAFNLGFRLARCAQILKVDADIVIDPAFFRRTVLAPGHFIAGNWRRAAEGQAFVNGFFYAHREDLAAVGGFNEYIRTYGWDDDDIYERLERQGVVRQDVDQALIDHLPHSDTERTGVEDSAAVGGLPAVEELRRNTLFMIRRNRFLANVLPVWKGDSPLLPFVFLEQSDGVDRVRRMVAESCPVPDHIFSDAGFYALLELTAWRLGPQVWELSREQLQTLLSRPFTEIAQADVAALLDNPSSALPAPGLAPRRARIFIDAQHGLGNRLRALGSAAAIAEATNRELVVVWQPDDHCDCRLRDLFDYDGAVEQHRFMDDAPRLGCDVYNYMTAEPGAQKDAPIVLQDGQSIYVRSAFVLQSQHSNWQAENRFIQSLAPVESIRDLVAGVRSPNDISAHVRMEGGKQYEHLPYESADNWAQEDHEAIAKWRAKSHFTHFMARIDALAAEGRADRIFVAADRPETYTEFSARYGDRVAYLPRSAYDRSTEQLQYALADAILLGQAPLLLGSTWSSFSELAQRLSSGGMKVEMSGTDF